MASFSGRRFPSKPRICGVRRGMTVLCRSWTICRRRRRRDWCRGGACDAGGRAEFVEVKSGRAQDSRGKPPVPEGATGASPYADWKPGTLVRHAQYGVGQLLWIRPAPGQTRAAIKFAGYGEKVLILEYARVEKLER
jgi:hypothetical protein